jgi:hypothetical protein
VPLAPSIGACVPQAPNAASVIRGACAPGASTRAGVPALCRPHDRCKFIAAVTNTRLLSAQPIARPVSGSKKCMRAVLTAKVTRVPARTTARGSRRATPLGTPAARMPPVPRKVPS